MERSIIQQCLRERLPFPKKIKDAPTLDFGLELYLSSFFELNSCRQIGFGEGPIPWTAIFDYCERLGIIGDQRDDMFYHIRSLDNAYLEHLSSNRKKT